jgi:ABC-type multidrug transport system fused ATPase/permease subunit
MAYWGGGGAGGWSGNAGPGPANNKQGRVDGWDYSELGRIYNKDLIRRLFPFVTPYKWRGLAAIFAMLLVSITTYSQPFLMAKALGAIIEGLLEWKGAESGSDEASRLLDEVNGLIFRYGAILVGLASAAFVGMFYQRRLTGYIGHNVLRKLRSDMFEHLNRLSMPFYDKEEVGRVMSRVTSDVTTLQELMTTGILTVLSDVFGLGLILFFMFWMDPFLAVVSLSVIPVLFIFMAIWQRYAARAFIRTRIAIALVNSNINENVSGIRVVQAMRRESTNLEEFDELNNQNLETNLSAVRLQGLVMPVVELLSSIATILVLIVIIIRLMNGSLNPVDAAAFSLGFLLFIQRFFNPVRDIVLQYTQLQRAMAGAQRVFEVLDTEPLIYDKPDAHEFTKIDGRVDFDAVDFEYLPGIPVLKKFDLHVQPGENIALVGHTGAGKTSITALIARFYDIQSGNVRVDGIDVRDIQLSSLTRRMSVVLQEPYLFSGSIADNIRYGRLDASEDDIKKAAIAVGASNFIEKLDNGYDSILHERGQNLSGGQRQLISFARALVADPAILVLDEATANIDTATEKVIQEALAKMLKGRTSFVIAHRLSTIRNADRIVMMSEGEILEIGNHEELMTLNGNYADLYRMGFEEVSGEDALSETTQG